MPRISEFRNVALDICSIISASPSSPALIFYKQSPDSTRASAVGSADGAVLVDAIDTPFPTDRTKLKPVDLRAVAAALCVHGASERVS